jgi:hypothetical protein
LFCHHSIDSTEKGFSVERGILYIVVVCITTTIYTPYFLLTAPSFRAVRVFEEERNGLIEAAHPGRRGVSGQRHS